MAEREHHVIYGQDHVFAIDMVDSTFVQPTVIVRGLEAEYELVFGPIEQGPLPKRPSNVVR